MKQFEQELTALKLRVLEMGTLAASMVAGASDALINAEPDRIQEVLASEPILDRFQIEIDREAIRLITIYTPVAKDLRVLLMIARINSELERIGDQAVNNCEYVEVLTERLPPLANLSTMSTTVLAMVHDALQAFREEDTERAQAVMNRDDQVDAINAQVFRQLLEHPAADAQSRARDMRLVLFAHSLERVADHATNVCEEVFYLVQGADIRHPGLR